MKFFIAFASLLYVYAYDIAMTGSMCACSKINYQNDCNMMTRMCQWSGSACANYNCTSLTNISTCGTAQTCAWVNNTCQTFTKCSDYSSSANVTCSVQGVGCNTSTTANSTTSGFNCVDMTATTTTTMAACTTFTTNATCMYPCFWSGTACRITMCSDYTSSATCTRAYSADYKTLKTCAWGTACTESSTMNLNAGNCMSYTSYMYTWNSASSTCMSCSSNSLILIVGLLSVYSSDNIIKKQFNFIKINYFSIFSQAIALKNIFKQLYNFYYIDDCIQVCYYTLIFLESMKKLLE